MTKTSIRFKAKLFRTAESKKAGSWTFLVLPKNASAKLPSRGMTVIEGTINGFPFKATLEPDGQKSHWLKVDRKLGKSAGAEADDVFQRQRRIPRRSRCVRHSVVSDQNLGWKRSKLRGLRKAKRDPSRFDHPPGAHTGAGG